MTRAEFIAQVKELAKRAGAERFGGTASQWCEAFLKFNEAGKRGAFSFYSREYLRQIVDCYSIDQVKRLYMCMGTRTGKTTAMFGGGCYRIATQARRALCVHPASTGPAGAAKIAKNRFIPLVKASPGFKDLLPLDRFGLTNTEQTFRNGSIVDWVGSNSVGQLASNPMSEIYLDEVDKFNVTKRRNEEGEEVEADACELADERATEFQYPKRVRASTPTLEGGRIWGDLMSSDLHRRHVPCPLCGRHHPSSRLVVIAWSERFTILPKTYGYGTPFEPGSAIPLAFVEWDKEARRIDGGWDLERVEKSAGYLCPHCNNRFQDDQKIWQDQEGKWFPTKQGEPDAHGFHLPSWYANHHQTTAGSLAKEFLKAKSSLAGPRNFVNSKCAEAFAFQGASINRVGKVAQHIEVTGEWLKIITVDYQQNAPYFWAVVRAWNGSNGTHGIEYRFFNNWYELDDLQKKHKVIATALGVDVGFQQPEVLQNCANIQMPTRCSLGDSIQGQLPECIGWTPMKSFGGKKLMRDDATGLYLPYRIKRDQDPYAGTDLAKTMRIELLEWLNDVFFDMLENIRAGKTGLAWTISPEMDTEEYHKHWAGVHRVFERGDPRAYKWKKRDSRWPEHIAKCEAMNLVMAYRLQLISFEAIATKENKPKEETPCLETSKSL